MDYIARKWDFKNESRNIKEGEMKRRKKEIFFQRSIEEEKKRKRLRKK